MDADSPDKFRVFVDDKMHKDPSLIGLNLHTDRCQLFAQTSDIDHFALDKDCWLGGQFTARPSAFGSVQAVDMF